MSSEQLLKFSTELKSAREESNLTLQMLNQKTRIDLKFLQAIEDGNFHIIDEVYIRAFIKGYAKNVGLDEDETLKKYTLATEGKYVDTQQSQTDEDDSLANNEKKVVFTSEYVRTPVSDNGGSKKIDKRFIILGTALIIITALVYLLFLSNDSNKIIKESKPLNNKATPPQQIERFEVVKPEVVNPVQNEIKSDSLALQIYANSRTWVRVLIDETDQVEFTLNPTETKTISGAKKFKLLVGNAGGITLKLNSKDLLLEGNSGDIKNVEIDSSGIRYLRIKPESKNGIN